MLKGSAFREVAALCRLNVNHPRQNRVQPLVDPKLGQQTVKAFSKFSVRAVCGARWCVGVVRLQPTQTTQGLAGRRNKQKQISPLVLAWKTAQPKKEEKDPKEVKKKPEKRTSGRVEKMEARAIAEKVWSLLSRCVLFCFWRWL